MSIARDHMKWNVMRVPKSSKARIIAVLVVVAHLCGISPIILLFNKPTPLILGLPPLFFWSYMVGIICLLVMVLARKWEVH